MKTLKNHTILFDGECPMCSVYTKAFVKTGMLDREGRKSYQQHAPACVNLSRAVNEIALINNETGEVTYGVQSLFKVLGNSFPSFRLLFGCKPFVTLMEKLYAFISYNRRVIVPSREKVIFQELQPAFRKDYRIVFLLLSGLIAAFILSSYAHLLYPLLPAGGHYREYLVCFGQIIVQGMIAAKLFPEKAWNYLGNMMTISFAGALLLYPIVMLSKYIFISPVFALGYFFIIVTLMLLEHIRRSKLLNIGWTLSVTWVIYRLVILFIILKMTAI